VDISDSALLDMLAHLAAPLDPELFARKTLHNMEIDKVRFPVFKFLVHLNCRIVICNRRCALCEQYRNVALAAFTGQLSLKKADLRDAMKEALDEDIPANLYTKIMKEFASYENGALCVVGLSVFSAG